MRFKIIAQAVLVAALAAVGVSAQVVLPQANANDFNDGPIKTTLTAGGIITMTGGDTVAPGVETGTSGAAASILPTAFVEVDGPIRFDNNKSAVIRFFGRLGISSEPGKSVSITDLQTYKSAEVGLGLYHYFGNVRVAGEAGWSSKLPTTPDPVDRVVKHLGIGMGIGALDSANITVLFGRDEAAGMDAGLGQFMVYGSVPIVGTDGALLIVGDATINISSAKEYQQRDIFRIGVVADIGQTISLLKK